ncbi:MAG TPA: SDR family oxidoreductase [Chitinophagales bacterium]|nr:SDR family oxidoreductase [Chitinophagales bacterium]
MNLDLTGKNAFVGGSSKGIGKAVAFELAKLGASITMVGRNEQDLMQNLIDLSFIGKGEQRHDYVAVDFSNPDKVKSAVERHIKKTNKTYHILVNNTGGPASGKITEAIEEDFIKTFEAHVITSHILTKLFLEGMRKDGYGRIVNIISTSVKQPLPNLGVSNTIRAAMANWAKTMANELGEFGITVNNVLPGATETDRHHSLIKTRSEKTGVPIEKIEEEMLRIIPLHRFGKPEEVANAVAFLASPAAAYISGINVPVDGGRTGCL